MEEKAAGDKNDREDSPADVATVINQKPGMGNISRFNIRVYAIIIKDDKVLLADEMIGDFACTKFPGGGVEYGEGLIEALKRELMEECDLQAGEADHLYTTDFFQASAFHPSDQVISVYYLVKTAVPWEKYHSDQSLNDRKHTIDLYFYPLVDLSAEMLTFPIDKHVLGILKTRFL
jgi:8-oxo-dGTP diphosphatase